MPPNDTKKPPRYGRLAIGLLISMHRPAPIRETRNRPTVDPRPCIVCGEPHSGNNAFCSADCCRIHKAR